MIEIFFKRIIELVTIPGGLQIVCKKLGQALQSLRVRQRKETNIQSKQIIMENKYRGGRGLPIQNFCELCKLKYHTDERKHEKSRSHLTIKAFLNKKCKLCDVRSNSTIFLPVSLCVLCVLESLEQVSLS